MLTIFVGDVPIRVEAGVLVPVIARQIENFGQLARAQAGKRLSVRERSGRVALKTVLSFYLDMVEADLDEAGDPFPRPKCPKGADYITFAVQYVAGYLAHQVDGHSLRLHVDSDEAGLRVTDVEVTGLAATVEGTATHAIASAAR